jgi:hypothetical protein
MLHLVGPVAANVRQHMTGRAESELKLAVVRDHDDECSVTATITTGPFSGSGRAWLHVADVSEFASSVKQLSGTSTGEAKLSGGYFNPDGSPNLTVSLRLLPHGERGHIVIAAELSSDPPSVGAAVSFVSRMSSALIVEPAALDRFADQLLNIPRGAQVEAVVPGESAA